MAETIDYKTKMALGYDQASDFYDKWIGNIDSWRYHWLLDDVLFPPDPTVLDVGCGTGLTTFEVMKKCQNRGNFFGIDISPGMIAKAQVNATALGLSNCEFIVGDAETLEYPDNNFDVVFSNSVFHWFTNKISALKEMHRVLKLGGEIAFRFNGGDFVKEFFEIAIRLEAQYPEFRMSPSWQEMKTFHSMSLEDAYDLFEYAGFQKPRLYSRKEIGYYDFTKTMVLKNAAWQFWQIGFSLDILDKFAEKAVEAAEKVTTEKGFKITTEIIVSYGTKAQ